MYIDLLFGGKVMQLDGDFKRLLAVIVNVICS